ncbi:protein COFACTOR ASSEMBLY OF COMPLEX C SUBUNIT B CCB4, chloroplastic isoform X2 [Brachypodium distachyon]|uniref:protein COFACTOR ASSEMBLY OF COMPLEX C SUBUNIT B CCB4, chloroplastic isoform X2 n=1 Tax=Brachypodium distachyon TaxID=15368 RepID=UPI00052FFBDF|nr:protein COFACTOR ASSEMBLY OF COMPLEX C SUBUNIT B CCB4, chloroplastic isoform X2 [Brachypodium distachyon]|eukprot:XP_010240534.1 protein COFACTOR ASSEMBLY OF COMPLEX C SUBUNIT B CCB4, chloroplastic isoform X2 [Brachypodium distachyon]
MELSLLRSRAFAPSPSTKLRHRSRLPSGPFSPPPSQQDTLRSRALRPRQEWVGSWVRSNDTLVRGLPILVGGVSLLAVLLNRALSGIAAVADASSSQSRADILTLALSVTDILAGLVWLSIRPKSISPVAPQGVECKRVVPGVSSPALHELLWTWDSLTAATCCKSLVVVYGGNCILQIGVAAGSPEDDIAVTVDAQKFTQESYLANLALYPGRSELPFLPANTQALILQPIGDNGIAIIGGDTIRGFTNLDQAWIAMIADKLDATLSKS